MAPPIGQEDIHPPQMNSERAGQRWTNKSYRNRGSYKETTNTSTKQIRQHNSFGSLDSTSTDSSYGKDERHVTSDKSTDGIEVAMNPRGDGMQLMHVAGTRKKYQDLPLTVEVQPTLQVSFIKMSTNYHPACDYASLHRIPIKSNKKSKLKELTMEEKFSLLEKYEVIDEETATRDEIHRNLIEMRNLENERDNINRQVNFDTRLASHRCSIPMCKGEFCLNKMLVQSNMNMSKPLDWDFKRYLQRRRGFCFHASFNDPDCRETFVEVCGGNRNTKVVHPILQECSQEPFHVDKVAASAAAVGHVALTKGSIGTSFFISKDDARSYYDDGLPQRLIDRLKKENIKSHANGVIRYLVCGPKESYYVKLISGLEFWSICTNDEEFKTVMDTFDVQRVAFGSFSSGPSWIVVGQDGKVAWRNLPCRLNLLLSKRTSDSAAPSEISLGEHGSYFIRFLDGEIDYCLPAHIAASCQEILRQGADITNIALHPEISDAFIIRHTQLP